jgi:hypothetical protein
LERRDNSARTDLPDRTLSTEAVSRRERKIARTRW